MSDITVSILILRPMLITMARPKEEQKVERKIICPLFAFYKFSQRYNENKNPDETQGNKSNLRIQKALARHIKR